ncbi:MAG TPA: hypothetical protein VF642_08385, partial [Propionibacteriaceae bacterium]
MTSVVTGTQPRGLADRCPGLLRPHLAEDGLLVRLRIPGGQTTSRVLLEVSLIAADLGTGSLQLTSRGNLQLRGLADRVLPELVERLAALGLLPSVSHERVRNVIASPLTGLDLPDADAVRQNATAAKGTNRSGRTDLRPMVAELDAAVCATAELAELPGRFLFALDDGRGDVSAVRFDLAYRAGAPGEGTVLVGDVR